jgi:hypothetical protein
MAHDHVVKIHAKAALDPHLRHLCPTSKQSGTCLQSLLVLATSTYKYRLNHTQIDLHGLSCLVRQ